MMKTSPKTKQHGGHNTGQFSPRNNGSGIVFEVRNALKQTRQKFAEAMSQGFKCTVRSIEKWEQTGTFPQRNVHHRANLLTLTLTVPEDQRTQTMRDFIEGEREFWRFISPPAVFL